MSEPPSAHTAMSSQRVTCSVHSFSRSRLIAFCCAGISRASSIWRLRSSSFTVTPRLGLALIQTFGSVQSSPASIVAMKANQGSAVPCGSVPSSALTENS